MWGLRLMNAMRNVHPKGTLDEMKSAILLCKRALSFQDAETSLAAFQLLSTMSSYHGNTFAGPLDRLL